MVIILRLYTYLKINAGLVKSNVLKLDKEKKITVNDLIIPLTSNIKDDDVVKIHNKIITKTEFKYYLYYKPKGVLSVISNNKDSYINHINLDIKLSLSGRLDKESEGLMILTNDGNFINELMKPNHHEKEYIIKLEKKITDDFINNIKKSYVIRGRITTPFKIRIIDDYNLNITLYEGIYHQIRTIIKLNNNKVINLKRIRIGSYLLGDLKENEIKEFKRG